MFIIVQWPTLRRKAMSFISGNGRLHLSLVLRFCPLQASWEDGKNSLVSCFRSRSSVSFPLFQASRYTIKGYGVLRWDNSDSNIHWCSFARTLANSGWKVTWTWQMPSLLRNQYVSTVSNRAGKVRDMVSINYSFQIECKKCLSCRLLRWKGTTTVLHILNV